MKLPPHAVEVDGLYLPKPVGGHPALDFCNTWAGWPGPAQPGSEWLRCYQHLVVWAGSAGLLKPATRDALRARTGRAADAVLDRARRLRGALYAVLRGDDNEAAFATVAAEATEANARTQFVEHHDRARFALPDSADVQQPLHATALAAAELLSGAERARVRACPATDCGWLFLDRSGRRTWCNMASCGNRAKVRTHAARRRH